MQFALSERYFLCPNGSLSSHLIRAKVNSPATKIGNHERRSRLDIRRYKGYIGMK